MTRLIQSGSYPYVTLLGSLACLSLSPIIVRYAQDEGIPSILIAGSRMLLAALIITPFMLVHYRDQIRRLQSSDLFFLTLTGIWMSINSMLVIISLEHIPVLINQILASTAPIWAALIESVWLKTRFHRLIWLGIVLVMVGSFIISLPQLTVDNSQTSLMGIGLALISAVCGAIYTAFGRHSRTRVAIMSYLWIVYGTGGAFAFLVVLLMQVPVIGYSLEGYGWIVASTLLVQLLGFSGIGFTLGYLPATLVVITTRSVALTSALLAFFLFSEMPTSWQIIGSLVLFCGIVCAVIGLEIKKKRMLTTEKG